MSKRFGRNQKRRMREEIASVHQRLVSQHEQIERLHQLLEVQTRKNVALEHVISGAKKALGKHSVAFEPVMRMAMKYWMPVVNFIPDGQIEQRFDFGLNTDRPTPEYIKQEVADVITFHVEQDHIARREHFYIHFKDHKVVGYAIERSAFEERHRGSFSDILENHIAVAMAKEFKRQYSANELRRYR